MQAHVRELNDNLVARLSDILLHKDFPLTTPEERSKAVAFLCKLIGFDDVELAAGVVEDYMIDKDDAADVRQVRTMRRPFKPMGVVSYPWELNHIHCPNHVFLPFQNPWDSHCSHRQRQGIFLQTHGCIPVSMVVVCHLIVVSPW